MRRETAYPELAVAEKLTLAAVLVAALVVSVLLCMHDHANYERYLATPEAQMTGQQMLDAYQSANPKDPDAPIFY